MPSCTSNAIDSVMALNAFCPQFDPESIPPYNDWVANTTFDPFGPEPVAAVHGSSDMTHNFSQERSRFAFAQKRIERPIDVSVSQIPVAHVPHSSVGRSRTPISIKATPARTPRVVGPRPPKSQRVVRARREPTLAVPKPVYPLPTWLIRFEDYEEEFLAEFCPPTTTPPLGSPNSGYTKIEVGDWCRKGDEEFDEKREDYNPFEFDTGSDFWSDYVSIGSESSAPASHRASALDWSAPFEGRPGGGEGYSRANEVTILEFPPQYSPSPPPSDPRIPSIDPFNLMAQPPNSLPWSIFTNPFTGAPITASPVLPPVISAVAHDSMDGYVNFGDADQFLAEMEEGLGFGSGPGSLPGSFEAEEEEWYDRFDLTGYTFPVPPQRPQVGYMAAGFEAPPPVRPPVIPLPDTDEDEDEDAELDAIVVSTKPSFWWR